MRAACFDGHFEIVKFLVENNADIEIANRHGHTCLMIACYKGHLAIAKYLITRGADLNRKSVKGNTALHDCAECGSLDIMKLLLSHSAKMAADSYNMTPLLAAAVTGHSAIVEYLLTRAECASLEKVHALELLGATFVDKKHDMLSAYGYWKSALERRNSTTTATTPESDTNESLSKSLNIKHNPIEAYDYATEFTTQNELDEIIADPDDMRMQALLIRERILGPTHPDTTYYIRYRGAVYADCGNFRKCILLWLYALDTQQKCLEPLHPMIQSSFLSFTELFQYMQKQLSPFNNNLSNGTGHSNSNTGREAGANSLAQNYSTNERNSMFSILNMYTSTVYKILQQAVEEIKRGLNLLALQNEEQKKSSNQINSLNSTASSDSINSSNYSSDQADSSLSASSSISSSSSSSSSSPKEETKTCNHEIINETTSSLTDEAAKASSSPITEQKQSTNSSTITASSNPVTSIAIIFDMSHFDRTLVVIVHFLIVVAESLKHCSPEETFKLKKLVYELIKLNPKNSKNSTLLHLASSRDSSSIIKNHTLSSFPSTEVLKLLLECGADANALDGERNSPLHLAAANRHSPLSSSSTSLTVNNTVNNNNNNVNNNSNETNNPSPAPLPNNNNNNNNSSSIVINSERDKLICLLLNSGTHLDACNINNKTAADLYKGGKMYQVINPINFLTLQCLAAKVIQKNKIPYREYLTTKLSNFVSIH